MNSLKIHFTIAPEVENALSKNLPVLALESTIVAHGMPYPENIEFAQKAEAIAHKYGVVPATIAIIDGKVHIGLNNKQLEILSNNKSVEKVAVRDLAFAISQKLTGATTVSATMHLAHLVGIDVFSTGGIGGVHRNAESTFDISQDLIELSRTSIIVVSAGVKAILDIPKTFEYLETSAVPVVGYQTNEFPAFYSRSSGLFLTTSCNTPKAIARIFNNHRKINLQSAVLIANPVPKSNEIPRTLIEKYIDTALKKCAEKEIVGKNITPFLLKNIVALTGGKSLKTNIALALNNVKVGAQIALALNNS
jgi:pseudouridine-5'-phosphate glycosidase